MAFLFSHPIWFALARLPFRRHNHAAPTVEAPVSGQQALSHIPAGRQAMSYMGCEMVALFNALHFLGRPRPLNEIIRLFEDRRWLLLGGRWGADPYAVGIYARENGLAHTVFRGKREYADFARALSDGGDRAFILSFWLKDSVFSGAHTVALVRREGVLWGYNLFNGQTAPIPVSDLSCLCYAQRFIVGYAFH